MSYKNLTVEQIFMGEVDYTLDDFTRDFRKKAKRDWGSKLDNNKGRRKTVYQAMLLLIVFTSQRKPPKLINEILAGKDTKKLRKILKDMTDMYKHEIKILEGLQMKMFIENIKKYQMSDSMNLMLLNADFRAWLERALTRTD